MPQVITPRFCPLCGSPLTSALAQAGGGPPLRCQACGLPVYLDPKVAVAAVVQVSGGVVLLRRAQRDQAHNRWILPGGHVDRGEVLPEAALREVAEETGLRARLEGLLGVYSYPGNPVVLTAYQVRAEARGLRPGREALEVKVFPPDQLPWTDMGYQSTTDILRDFLARMQASPEEV